MLYRSPPHPSPRRKRHTLRTQARELLAEVGLNHRLHNRKLLGRARARVLEAITERPGCTTTEQAAAARIAVASEYAAVLRQAGLICTVRHTAPCTSTPLGLALLNSRSRTS